MIEKPSPLIIHILKGMKTEALNVTLPKPPQFPGLLSLLFWCNGLWHG